MNKSHVQRLGALERKTAQQSHVLIAMQDYTNPNIFHGHGETTYTGAELDALSAQGWQVVKIVFVDRGIRRE